MSPAARTRLARIVGASALLVALSAASACGGGGDKDPAASGSPSSSLMAESAPEPSGSPSEEEDKAKGACEYFDVAAVGADLGVKFEVVQPAEGDNAQVCVLQTTKGSFPDLTLATAKTKADKASFQATMMPEEADGVDGLGKAGYQVLLKERDGSGPVAEIGWLSNSGRIFTLRFTSAKGTGTEEVEGHLDKLVEIAKAVEKQT